MYSNDLEWVVGGGERGATSDDVIFKLDSIRNGIPNPGSSSSRLLLYLQLHIYPQPILSRLCSCKCVCVCSRSIRGWEDVKYFWWGMFCASARVITGLRSIIGEDKELNLIIIHL